MCPTSRRGSARAWRQSRRRSHGTNEAAVRRGRHCQGAQGYSAAVTIQEAKPALPPDVLESLEQLIFGAIGLTSFALADVDVAELTLGQWRAMVVIGRSDGLRVGEIAARVGMSLPSTSRLISRLERHGYVTTARDETDRRATLVRMTDEGHRVRSAVIDRRRQLMNNSLAAYGSVLPKDLSRGLATLARAFAPYE